MMKHNQISNITVHSLALSLRLSLYVYMNTEKKYRGKEMNFFVENIQFIADHLSLSQ